MDHIGKVHLVVMRVAGQAQAEGGEAGQVPQVGQDTGQAMTDGGVT